uniref:Uncharacterized protein n=1 Tax=Alexandrium catenella TaxID=2925 RepID=A0A7S1RIU1_ALECA|mmetsp:Transcript_59472/g.159279  ORF Transcript_59472/g.159279 Transcript_59472/m.159279 type:complete len:258 (+) Transcript_59472:101-874(+)
MQDAARPAWHLGGQSAVGYLQNRGHMVGWPQGYAPVPSNDREEAGRPLEERSKEALVAPPAAGPDPVAPPAAGLDLAVRKAEQQAAVFDTYAICSSILTGFSCSASYMSVSELQAEDMVVFIITNLQQWLVRLCTAMGIYSVLIFTFCAMYSRSCLARPGKLGLEIYTLYMRRTGKVRVRAFYNMYSMALLYSVSVVLSCWISFDPLKASVAAASLALVVIITIVDTRSLISVAALIYAPEEAVQDALRELKEEEEQ